MDLFEEILLDIEKGRKGLNKGLPIGLPRTNQILCGLQRGTYYLLGGDTGSGKSLLVNNMFILNPLEFIAKYPGVARLKIIYFSFEMIAKSHILRAIPRKLWLDRQIITNPNLILSRGAGNSIPEAVYEEIKAQEEYFKKIISHIDFYDSAMGKAGIEEVLAKYARKNGKIVGEPGNEKYIPNDENLYTLVILDHNGLSKREGEASVKIMIDDISKIFVRYRNLCNFSFVVLNQFNRDIQSSDRKKLGAIEPQLSDFKDTSGSQEDADVVLAICDPWRYGLTSYKGFNIDELKDRFRAIHVLKSRSGESMRHVGLNFFGDIGYFKELPRAKDMTPADYELAVSLEKQAELTR